MKTNSKLKNLSKKLTRKIQRTLEMQTSQKSDKLPRLQQWPMLWLMKNQIS